MVFPITLKDAKKRLKMIEVAVLREKRSLNMDMATLTRIEKNANHNQLHELNQIRNLYKKTKKKVF